MYSQFARSGRVHSFLRHCATLCAAVDGSVHTERTRLATFTKLNSGSWRAQVRRKGKYVNETFLRRKDAEEWALEVGRATDRGEPAIARTSRDAKTFGDLVKLHREDLQEVGKRIGRSKAASLTFLEHRLGRLRIPDSTADGSSSLEKNGRAKARVQLLSGSTLDISKPFFCTRQPFMA
jgi:hypothetical protein